MYQKIVLIQLQLEKVNSCCNQYNCNNCNIVIRQQKICPKSPLFMYSPCNHRGFFVITNQNSQAIRVVFILLHGFFCSVDYIILEEICSCTCLNEFDRMAPCQLKSGTIGTNCLYKYNVCTIQIISTNYLNNYLFNNIFFEYVLV